MNNLNDTYDLQPCLDAYKAAMEMKKIIYKYRLDDRLSTPTRKWCEKQDEINKNGK